MINIEDDCKGLSILTGEWVIGGYSRGDLNKFKGSCVLDSKGQYHPVKEGSICQNLKTWDSKGVSVFSQDIAAVTIPYYNPKSRKTESLTFVGYIGYVRQTLSYSLIVDLDFYTGVLKTGEIRLISDNGYMHNLEVLGSMVTDDLDEIRKFFSENEKRKNIKENR